MSADSTPIHARSDARGPSPTRAASVRSLKDFLATPAARRCTRIWVIRTSAESKRDFEAMFNAGVAMAPSDPDVQVLAGVGHRIVMPEGAPDRDRLGAMELRRGSVNGGFGTKLLGWLIPIGSTMFVLYLSTARTADLPGPTPDQARNAFTEALVETVREIRPQRLYAPLLSRIFRNIDFGGQVLRTLREFGVEVWVEGRQLDFSGGDGKFRGLIEAHFASRDAESLVQRLQGIEASIYADGAWYGAPAFLPFTWRPRPIERTDPLTGEVSLHVPDIRDLEVTPNSVEVFDQFALMLGQRSRTLDDIGRALGRLGVRSRNPSNFTEPKLLSDLAQPASAVATLIQPRWLDAWLTGDYRTAVKLRADLRDSHPGMRDIISTRENEHGQEELWLDVTIPLPMPARGYWLTQGQHDLIMDVRHASTPQRIGRASGSGDRRPLASLSQWDDPEAGRQYRLGTFDSSDTYSVLWRPLSQALDANGSPLGWAPQHRANKLAAVNAQALHASIGQQLLDLAARLEGLVAPLSLPVRQADATTAPLLRAEASLSAAKDALVRVQARAKGIRRDRQEARGRGDDAEVEALDQDLAEAGADLARAEADVQEANDLLQAARAATPDAPETVAADLGTVELVGVALMRCGPRAPGSLNHALAVLLRDSLRVVADPTGLAVTWTATVTVPLVGGGEGTHDVSSPGPIPGVAFTTRRVDRAGKAGSEKASPDWDDRLAQAFFDEGRPLAEVAGMRGVDTSGRSESYPVKRLRAWLAKHAVANSKRRLAAMDAPGEVRQALAPLLRGRAPASPYEQVLLDAYLSDQPWGVCWAASTHDHARALHEAVEALGGTAVDPEAACQLAGLTWGQMVLATSSRRLLRADGLQVEAGPALHRNWTSLGRGQDRALSLHACPHPDCLSRRKAGTPGVLVQLLVPELSAMPARSVAALLCRSCRRRPDNADAVFPAFYLQPWRGGRRIKAIVDGRETWVGTHLPAPSTNTGGPRHAHAA